MEKKTSYAVTSGGSKSHLEVLRCSHLFFHRAFLHTSPHEARPGETLFTAGVSLAPAPGSTTFHTWRNGTSELPWVSGLFRPRTSRTASRPSAGVSISLAPGRKNQSRSSKYIYYLSDSTSSYIIDCIWVMNGYDMAYMGANTLEPYMMRGRSYLRCSVPAFSNSQIICSPPDNMEQPHQAEMNVWGHI